MERFTDKHARLRRGGPTGIRIGSSEVPVICGISPYSSPFLLFDQLVTFAGTQHEPEENDMMKHGRICEEFSASLYTSLTGNQVEKGNYFYCDDPKYSDLFGCSPDRKVIIGGKWEGLLDIRNPCYALPKVAIRDSDVAQIQYQLFVTKKEWCDHLVTLYEFGNASPDTLMGLKMTRVYFSQEYWEWLLPQLLEFSQCLQTKVRPISFNDRPPLPPPPKVNAIEYTFET